MKGYRIAFIRHGITEANEDGRYIGTTDLPQITHSPFC